MSLYITFTKNQTLRQALSGMLDLEVYVFNPGRTLKVRLHHQPFATAYTKDMLKKDGVERVVLGTPDSPKASDYSSEGTISVLGKAAVAPSGDFYNHYGAGAPYGIYNWEIDFHLPLLVANRLSQTQRYEEAQRWYHFIFDPTRAKNGKAWVFKPFKDEPFSPIEELLGDTDHRDFQSWYENPFLPHAVASFRIEAYMMYTIMKYLDNLIEWGDNLFRRDTIESINEATQYYVLASNILGPRSKAVPKQKNTNPLTYANIRAGRDVSGEDGLANPHVDIALSAPFATDRPIPEVSGASTLYGIVQNVAYFGVPANKKLLEYWDKVADRLFKIRNCQNIEGVVRELPLFEPPIDPALLIRAALANIDLTAVINDLYAPLPNYRFQLMLQKANEYCNEVKAFGNALLSALEKKDGEQLGIIRARHEQELLGLTRVIKENQRKEAEQALEGLRINHEAAKYRYEHYEKMLGHADKVAPDYKSEEIKNITDFEPKGFSRVKMIDSGGIKIISEESRELDQGRDIIAKNEVASVFETIAGFSNIIPNISVGIGTTSVSFGGSNLGAAFSAIASIYRFESNKNSIEASTLAKTGSWILRQDEWMQQSRAAALEINQLKRQMLAAEIRIDIAEKEIENHEIQIQNTQEVYDFIAGDDSVVKFTSNATLYNWMVGQLMMLYRQSYKMAHDLAKQAERCYRHEVGLTDTNFIQFNYWDNDKKGLLSGDRLSNALRQMEKAYMDQNKREFEITKHISLNQLNPLALLNLREKGKCDFAIPEEFFDLDFPGHYFRRIKSVSITIPCVAGPYTTINATLRLKTNSMRIKSLAGEPYARPLDDDGNPEGDDHRFRDQLIGIQSIAASSGQNDSGLFELNFRDERYLPFEGAGAISRWSLEMMHEQDENDLEGVDRAKRLRQFDYNTIADVIVHLRYTAREDGGLKPSVMDHLGEIQNELGKVKLMRLFSLRSDFPNEWYRWIKGTESDLIIALEKHHFPYMAQMSELNYDRATLFSESSTILRDKAIDNGTRTLTITETEVSKDNRNCYAIVYYSIVQPNSGAPDDGTTGTGLPGGGPTGGGPTDNTGALTASLQLMTTEVVKNKIGAGSRVRLALPAEANTADSLLFVTPRFDQTASPLTNKANFVSWLNNAWWVNTTDEVAALSLHVAVAANNGAGAFQHIANVANLYKPEAFTIREKYATELNHPALNDNPDAIIFATQVRGAHGPTEIGKNRHTAVWYDPARRKWAIVFPSRYDIPAGAVFNILIGAGPNAFRHTVTPGSIHGSQPHVTLLSPTIAQNKVLMAMEYWPYPELATDTNNVLSEVNLFPFNLEWYAEYGCWGIFTLVNAPIKQGMEFNIWAL